MRMQDCDGTRVEPGDKITVLGTILGTEFEVVDVPTDSVWVMCESGTIRFESKYVRKVQVPVRDRLGRKIVSGDKVWHVLMMDSGTVTQVVPRGYDGKDVVYVTTSAGTKYVPWYRSNVVVLSKED